MKKIKTIRISFDNPLRRNEIPSFRGAVVASLEKDNLLFHNHLQTSLRYAYPLIQYKRLHGKAAIVCIGEGTEAIGEFFSSANFNVKINEREETLKIENITADQTLVQCWQEPISYRIRHWLPLNEKNYAAYISTTGMAERIQMLEKILTGNILSALKGMDITMEEHISCTITDFNELGTERFKDVKLMSMDAEFLCNVSLPEYIGLGRHASVGFGVITKKNEKKK